MADFPYSLVQGSMKKFFAHIQDAGVPTKVTISYLGQVGFKSKNDRAIIPVLRQIGFVDSSNTPTKLWRDYRNRSGAPATLASAIRRGYSDLFATYPDAHRKDNEALRDYFAAHTNVGDRALGAIVQTFKTLCELADFEAERGEPEPIDSSEGRQLSVIPRQSTKAVTSASPAININVQLQLPATEDPAVYEHLFAALKKHLLSE